MFSNYDVIVLGLGAMGSSAAYHLSRRHVRVLGLDRFQPPHDRGSSHGHTRIIREAYFEDPAYVPLIQRSYLLWNELERFSTHRLYQPTGGLMIGPAQGAFLQGVQASVDTYGLDHERLTAGQVRDRFPGLQPGDSMEAIWEPRAGILYPELCIRTHLDLASQHGAQLQFDEQVREWNAEDDGVVVKTCQGEYRAEKLILSAGSWLPDLWPDCPVPLQVERQTMFWLSPRKKIHYQIESCPVHVWETAPNEITYGFPLSELGVKLARHAPGEPTHPDRVDRTVAGPEAARILDFAEEHLPHLGRTILSHSVCLYTRTPTGHFLIDRHPDLPQLIVASPCSGHGFKFSAVIGEILADLATDKDPHLDIRLFALPKSAAA